jgi:hypothetical protein
MGRFGSTGRDAVFALMRNSWDTGEIVAHRGTGFREPLRGGCRY